MTDGSIETKWIGNLYNKPSISQYHHVTTIYKYWWRHVMEMLSCIEYNILTKKCQRCLCRGNVNWRKKAVLVLNIVVIFVWHRSKNKDPKGRVAALNVSLIFHLKFRRSLDPKDWIFQKFCNIFLNIGKKCYLKILSKIIESIFCHFSTIFWWKGNRGRRNIDKSFSQSFGQILWQFWEFKISPKPQHYQRVLNQQSLIFVIKKCNGSCVCRHKCW